MQDSRSLRVVDRAIGSPLCWLLTWARRARNLFRVPALAQASPLSSPERILLVELFEMGAAIMLMPSIAYLKKRNPRAEIYALTTKSCLPAWRAIQEIPEERLIALSSDSAVGFLWSAATVIWKMRAIPFDLIIDYQLFMRISVLIVGALKARVRSGFYRYALEGLDRGAFYSPVCSYNQNTHISRNYLALTRSAAEGQANSPNFKGEIVFENIQISPKIPRPLMKNIDVASKGKIRSRYITICPDVGKTLSVRNYPVEYFAKAIDLLLEQDGDLQVVLIGTAENGPTARKIIGLVAQPVRCVDLCGQTEFSELLTILGGADLLITNDNGPGHFAALTGTKTLALFSTDSPTVYGPLGSAVVAYTNYHCSPCISAYNHKRSLCKNNLCLQTLRPERVVELASQILAEKIPYRTINGKVPYVY